MQVKILGSGAGGGFPQWNCACANCSAFRAGRFQGSPRTQTQLAVRVAANSTSPWVLINASPDLRGQILADRDFSPRKPPRHSPIEAVVLTGAEIDQVMGLLHLREFQPLSVFSTRRVEAILRDGTSLFRSLNSVDNQVKWRAIKTGRKWDPVTNGSNGPNDANEQLTLEAFPMAGKAPAYAGLERAEVAGSGDEVIGILIECSGKKVLCVPNLPSLDEKMIKTWNEYDVLLVDGTFWSDDELRRVVGSGKLAREMGHVPMSGADGTLARLAKLKKPRKVFVHINNTNPVLNEESGEHQKVSEAGWEVAFDGMEIELN